ncbi:MAG: 50S ribosomal protein L22 [Endomicrobiia bacterium]
MGARKRLSAAKLKENKTLFTRASLNNVPTSPRKMRLVVDLIRGKEVNSALDILRFTKKECAKKVEKLVMSALSNWQQNNPGLKIEDEKIFIKEAYVNEGRMLKRVQPAPQGRAYRIRKRSNHVSIVLDSINVKEQ